MEKVTNIWQTPAKVVVGLFVAIFISLPAKNCEAHTISCHFDFDLSSSHPNLTGLDELRSNPLCYLFRNVSDGIIPYLAVAEAYNNNNNNNNNKSSLPPGYENVTCSGSICTFTRQITLRSRNGGITPVTPDELFIESNASRSAFSSVDAVETDAQGNIEY